MENNKEMTSSAPREPEKVRRTLIGSTVDKMTTKVSDRISEMLYSSVTRIIKNKFGAQLFFCDWDITDYRLAQAWLYKKDPKKYMKHTRKLYAVKPKDDETFAMDLDICNYYIRLEEETGTFCHVVCNEDKDENGNGRIKYLTIYIFGKKYKTYYKELVNKIKSFMKIDDKLFVMKCNDKNGGWPTGYRVAKRDFSTIFIDKETKEQIIRYLHKWRSNRELFISRGLNYKSGILLHGEPGTGKSSIAKAIAAEMNCTLLILDVNTINKIEITSALREASQASPTGTVVVLLEDIDCIVGKRDDKKSKLSEDQQKSLNTMLQLLDGINEVANVIFVATTNHFDRLDWALIRPSRFDIKPEIGRLNKNLAIDMCNSFNVNPDKILPKDMVDINPSELQDKIIKHIMGVNL